MHGGRLIDDRPLRDQRQRRARLDSDFVGKHFAACQPRKRTLPAIPIQRLHGGWKPLREARVFASLAAYHLAHTRALRSLPGPRATAGSGRVRREGSPANQPRLTGTTASSCTGQRNQVKTRLSPMQPIIQEQIVSRAELTFPTHLPVRRVSGLVY